MATISFSADFSTAPMDLHPPEGGYHFELEGDACMPSDAEMEYLFVHTPAALLKLTDSSTPNSFKGEIRVKASERSIVRSAHYTWHVKRADGRPLSPEELSYAFATQAFARLEEKRQPVVTLPLSALRRLLDADKDAAGTLVAALADADRQSGEVVIDDQKIASILEGIGLVDATNKPGRYFLVAINVT